MRHPNLFSKNNSAILLVDYQEKFIPVLPFNKQTVKNIRLLLNGVHIYKVPVFVSEQVPEKLGPTISDIKDLLSDAKYFSKKTMSCCGNEQLLEELKQQQIKQIGICGIEAHVCVLQSSLDLIANGFQVHLVLDAITSRIPYNIEVAVDKIKSAGGLISSVETILFEIAYESGNEEFKKLQQLFKTGV